ncbi:hypothetical protein [Streptomyces sp. NPDC049906]|uniref:hypothetical protein n=1 Tax=Streptomyces sp. NPDC049906 TaxID=3155656 RepID=UPI0034377610
MSTLAFGLAALGVGSSMADGLQSGPLTGVAVALGVVALVRRIWGSKIILDKSTVAVVNPIFTYVIPARDVLKVETSSGGSLSIQTIHGDLIPSAGFAGSLIDHMVGSAIRAIDQVDEYVAATRHSKANLIATKRVSTSWFADICAVGAVVCAIAALAIGD